MRGEAEVDRRTGGGVVGRRMVYERCIEGQVEERCIEGQVEGEVHRRTG